MKKNHTVHKDEHTTSVSCNQRDIYLTIRHLKYNAYMKKNNTVHKDEHTTSVSCNQRDIYQTIRHLKYNAYMKKNKTYIKKNTTGVSCNLRFCLFFHLLVQWEKAYH